MGSFEGGAWCIELVNAEQLGGRKRCPELPGGTLIRMRTLPTAIYSQLFRDGVLVAPKNFEVEHPELEGVANLHVVKAMQSLTSKGFVHTQFSWQWYFYVLTNEGLEYLREYLHLPSEIVPATHKRPQRPARSAPGPPREGGAYRAPRGDRPERGGDRDEYRSRRDAGKEGAPGEGFRPRYAAAGVGRGAPQ
ncbi:hypothetical protein CF319_g581 [Tilletia indica]|nr:hypothetical protein CF319_g581 [Tilletia indica]